MTIKYSLAQNEAVVRMVGAYNKMHEAHRLIGRSFFLGGLAPAIEAEANRMEAEGRREFDAAHLDYDEAVCAEVMEA